MVHVLFVFFQRTTYHISDEAADVLFLLCKEEHIVKRSLTHMHVGVSLCTFSSMHCACGIAARTTRSVIEMSCF